MKDLTTEQLLKETDNIYSLVIVAAKRTAALTRGGKSLLPDIRHLKPAIVALEEIKQAKVAPVLSSEAEDEKKA